MLATAAGSLALGVAAVAFGVLPQQSGTVGLLTQANVTINGGAAGDDSGRSVAGAGDVNGDGAADVIMGAPTANPSSRSNAGTVGVARAVSVRGARRRM